MSESNCANVRFGPRGAYPGLMDPGMRLWKAATTLAGRPQWG